MSTMRAPNLAACTLLMLTISFATPQDPPKSSIEGVVEDAGTGGPVANARVTLMRSHAVAAGLLVPAALPATTTDREGRYVFTGIEAGTYRVAVAAEGYASQEYGQPVLGRSEGTFLTVTAGQAVKDIRVRLTPTGTVTGYIRTNAGQPAVGVQVRLVAPMYGPTGERRLASAGAGKANDRGEYRIYWVTPGRYYLVAGSLDAPFGSYQSIESGGLGGSPNEYQTGSYGVTFHPGVSDVNDAAMVTAQSGAELKLDLVVARERYRVRGRVIDARSGQWPANAQVTLGRRRLLEGAAGSFVRTIPEYNPVDGTFEIRDVPTGLYYLSVNVPAGGPPGNGASGPIPVTVSGSDVDSVLATVEPYVSIPGQLTIEGQELPAPEWNRLHVFLNLSSAGRRLTDTSYGAIGGQSAFNPNGAFTINNVMGGEYRLYFMSPPNYYIKEARYNGADVLNGPLRVSSSTPGDLAIVLSSKTGTIAGTVIDFQGQPGRGVQAILIPDEHRDRSDLYRTATTDEAGRVTLTGVAPGNYKLFAWEALEQYAYYDPQVLDLFERQGTPVHISESSTASAEVKMIPAK